MELKGLLNEAHFLHREAERELKKGNIASSISHHKEAQNKLRILLEGYEKDKFLFVDPNVKNSLILQAQFHQKQEKLIQLRNQQRQKMTEEQQQGNKDNYHHHLAAPTSNTVGEFGTSPGGTSNLSLQNSIYRAFEETEALLQNLRVVDVVEAREAQVAQSKKLDKEDKEIIEELEVTNSHLRNMVRSLFQELEKITQENTELKAKVERLEKQIHSENTTQSNVMDLPPLEVPTFDYSLED